VRRGACPAVRRRLFHVITGLVPVIRSVRRGAHPVVRRRLSHVITSHVITSHVITGLVPVIPMV